MKRYGILRFISVWEVTPYYPVNSKCFFYFWRNTPQWDQGLLIEVSRSHTTHHSRWDASGRVISPSQRPLPDNTQHSQQTDIHVPLTEFEPTMPANERPQCDALDRAGTGTGWQIPIWRHIPDNVKNNCCYTPWDTWWGGVRIRSSSKFCRHSLGKVTPARQVERWVPDQRYCRMGEGHEDNITKRRAIYGKRQENVAKSANCNPATWTVLIVLRTKGLRQN